MCSIFWSFLSKKIYPLFISKFIGFTFLILLTIIPYLINTDPSNYVIFCIQIYLVGFGLSITPSESICIKHFPIFKRFTAISFGYALSRALMYIITSFGLILLTDQFGFYGIWILGIPLTLLWLKAIYYYESLEKHSGNYPLKGEWQVRART